MLPFHPFDIRKTIAETVNVNPDDTLRTKRALGRLGYYEPPKSHGKSIGFTDIPDENLFVGLRRFQQDQGLKRDGVMKPGGPTAIRLGRAISQVFAERHKPVPTSISEAGRLGELFDALGSASKRQSLLGNTSFTPGPSSRKPEPPVVDPEPSGGLASHRPDESDRHEPDNKEEDDRRQSECTRLKDAVFEAEVAHAAIRENHSRMVELTNKTQDELHELQRLIDEKMAEAGIALGIELTIAKIKKIAGLAKATERPDIPTTPIDPIFEVLALQERFDAMETSFEVFRQERDDLHKKRQTAAKAWRTARAAWTKSGCSDNPAK